jgi:hypothetical protein
MNKPCAGEGRDAFDMGWEVGFTTVTGGLDYMLRLLATDL